MTEIATAVVAILGLLGLLAVGMPVAFAMGTVAVVGMYLTVGERFLFSTLRTLPYSIASQYTFLVIPMFILMGVMASRVGLITDLYTAVYRLTSRLKGSLYFTTILASAGFSAASGSTIVSSSVFARMALPEMRRLGYPAGISAGCIAAAGTLAAMIPPSIVMVLYAILTDQSIGALLIAGVIPGVLSAAMFMIGIRVFLVFRPDWAPLGGERFSLREKAVAVGRVWAFALLALIVIGGIYSGAFSPSSAGTVGAFGILVISTIQGRMTGKILWDSLVDSLMIAGKIFLIIIFGFLISRFVVVAGLIGGIEQAILDAGIGVRGFMTIVIVLFLILGMFVDAGSMLVITLPFLFPISMTLGIDPIWFGVIIVKLVEVSTISPPVGLNLYAILSSSVGQVTTRQLFRGVVPFLAIEAVTLAALLAFPALSLWLPRLMF